jgi:aminoglycoside phosphotransferase (APT) family kinase protein
VTNVLPWATRHPLDAARVEALVAAQFPDLGRARAEYLDEGWDSVVYVVHAADGPWIFRFPKREEVAATHDVERALLPVLAPRLPLPVPLPTRVGGPDDGYPYRFLGYRRLEGTPAISLPLDAVDVGSTGERFGAFLTALHAFPADEARALGVPERVEQAGAVERWRSHTRETWDRLAPAMDAPLRERARAYLEAPPAAAAAPYRGPPTLVHYDLGDAHVLVDVAARGVAGVIDWGDVCCGDPAIDVAGLLQWLGDTVLAPLLAAYRGARIDDAFLARARAGAVYASFAGLWYGLEANRPEHVRSGLRSLAHALPGVPPTIFG